MTRPLYRKIADSIRARIDAGEFGEDEPLPTEESLSEQLSVNRQTVRQAYNVLVSEGRVVTKSTRGRFVRGRRHDVFRPQEEFGRPTSDVMDRFMARVSSEGREPSQTIAVEVIKPPRVPPVVADRLGTGDGPVVLRRRTRSIDGEPYNINDSYYPQGLVEGSEIMLPDDIARGANEVLAELGARQVRAIDEVTARTPTADEVQRLQLLPATQVMELVTTGFTAEDRPVRCVVNVLPADRYEIAFERTQPTDPQE